MSRTLEMNTLKIQAMKELGLTEVNDENVAELMYKIDEIQARKARNYINPIIYIMLTCI